MAHDYPQSLSKYIKHELGITRKEFAELEEVSIDTLKHRWKTIKGRLSIRDAVHRRKTIGDWNGN